MLLYLLVENGEVQPACALGENQHRMPQAQLAKCTETRLTAAFALC
jgi:hypothetical protein